MTDRDIVERAAVLIDRAVVPIGARRSHYKTPYVTVIKGAPAVALMRAVHAQMGSLRAAQIERAIASWHGHDARWRRPAAHCSVAECSRPGSRRGLCRRHYDRWWKAQRRGRATDFVPLAPPAPLFPPVGGGPDISDQCAVAWLAGLLEGEGSFTLNRYSPEIAYPVVGVQMCDASVVARAARLIGAPSVWRREPAQLGWSPTYVTAISGHRAAIWMRKLRGLMGVRRGAAIDAALAAYHPIRLVDAPSKCVVPGCSGAHRGRGLCHKHYMMWSRDRAQGRDARIVPLR